MCPFLGGIQIPEDKEADFGKEFAENYKTVSDYDKQKLKLVQAKQKRRILVEEITGEILKEQVAQIKLQMLWQYYKAFSKAADLPL